MKRFVLLVVACLVLAGCGGKDKDDPTPTPTPSSASSSSTGVAAGSIEVTLNRTTPDGAFPLQVNFTLNATFTRGGSTVATPASASWNVTYVLLGNGTGNATGGNATGNATGNSTGNLTQGPVGTSLPANVTLDLTTAGNYSIMATVKAPGFTPGNASFIAAVFGGSSGGAVLFFDGGETDESQWVLGNELVFDYVGGRRATGEEHPAGGWKRTDAETHAGANSWTTAYVDHYESRMTSIPFPAGASTLSYWLKGGAEDNGADGLHILVGADEASLEEVAYHSGAGIDWTEFTVAIPAGTTVVQFFMFGDASCSDMTPVGAPSPVCGEGWDAGGYFVDDITVA